MKIALREKASFAQSSSPCLLGIVTSIHAGSRSGGVKDLEHSLPSRDTAHRSSFNSLAEYGPAMLVVASDHIAATPTTRG